MDLTSLPLPDVGREASNTSPRIRTANTHVIPEIEATDHIRLAERSNQWGLEGIGAGNFVSEARLGPLIRSTGVGGGAIDYDLDGRPDLVVIGAGGTMMQRDSKPNELFHPEVEHETSCKNMHVLIPRLRNLQRRCMCQIF